MTEDQALQWYWESFRQNARERLQRLEELTLSKSSEGIEKLNNKLNDLAYPVDPEGDGDFDKDDIKMLKSAFGKFKEVNVE
ncbi:MAG: hypothetical protein ACFFD1_02020 [Candidatus Thorarchaeota archaeon]